MNNKLSTSLLLMVAIALVQLPTISDVYAAEPVKAEKKKRKSKAMSARVGKKVAASYELFDLDKIPEAITLLAEIEAKDDFDKASVNRYLGSMYATIDKMEEAEKYIRLAVEADVLNTADHAGTLKLLAGLVLQAGKYDEAVKYYYDWMEFTGKSDGDTWARIASAYYSSKKYSKVIEPADNAIRENKKPNKNPYVLKVQAYYELKQYQNAVNVLESAVLALPEDHVFWTQLATFYTLVEDYNNALATFELSYKLGYLTKANQIKALVSLYRQFDMPHKAAKLMEKHIASGLLKNDITNLTSLAGSWQSAMHIGKAAKYYGELAALSQKAKHYNQQGMLYKQDEQFSKAIVALNKALELGYKNKGAIHMAIAESYFYLEKYKQAYVAIKKASKEPKTKKMAKGWIGFIEAKAKRNNVSI